MLLLGLLQGPSKDGYFRVCFSAEVSNNTRNQAYAAAAAIMSVEVVQCVQFLRTSCDVFGNKDVSNAVTADLGSNGQTFLFPFLCSNADEAMIPLRDSLIVLRIVKKRCELSGGGPNPQ